MEVHARIINIKIYKKKKENLILCYFYILKIKCSAFDFCSYKQERNVVVYVEIGILNKTKSPIKNRKKVEKIEEMDHTGGGFAASPWAAVLGHHTIGTATEHPGFAAHAHNAAAAAAAAAAAHHAHHGMPMDLHVPQGFPYYR